MNKKMLLILLTLLTLSLAVSPAHASGGNQVGLVIEFGDGSTYATCVSFDGPSLTGLEVLARSGLGVETAFDPNQGAAVCKIGGDGCAADDCFCAMPDYWSYWNLSGDGWVYSGAGASNNRLSHGDVDGWAFGPGDPPPDYAFSELCAPPPPTLGPTNTAVLPTAPPAPTSTLVPPTDTPPPAPEQPEPSDTEPPPPTLPPSHTPTPMTPSVEPIKSPAASQTQAPTLRPTLTSTIAASRTHTPTGTHTQTGFPTLTQASQITSSLSPVPQDIAGNGNPLSSAPYFVFIILVAGLGAGLVIVSRRRSQ